MTDPRQLRLSIDTEHAGSQTLSERIYAAIRQAILDGSVRAGARLPPGRDLSVQLGVARGTVRAAFERLADEGLVFSAGAAGTRVAVHEALIPPDPGGGDARIFRRPLDALIPAFSSIPLPFQTGVPANDAFPAKVWGRLRTRAIRQDAMAPTSYADPRGEPALRG